MQTLKQFLTQPWWKTTLNKWIELWFTEEDLNKSLGDGDSLGLIDLSKYLKTELYKLLSEREKISSKEEIPPNDLNPYIEYYNSAADIVSKIGELNADWRPLEDYTNNLNNIFSIVMGITNISELKEFRKLPTINQHYHKYMLWDSNISKSAWDSSKKLHQKKTETIEFIKNLKQNNSELRNLIDTLSQDFIKEISIIADTDWDMQKLSPSLISMYNLLLIVTKWLSKITLGKLIDPMITDQSI